MTTPNINPSDLDREALNKAYEAYDKAFPESGFITYEGLRAGIRAYLTTLPRASGVPEAEAVAWQVEALPHVFLIDQDEIDEAKRRGTSLKPVFYASPPPVAAPSGEAKAAIDTLHDAMSALRYIRMRYGNLEGVGFDRVEQAADKVFAVSPVAVPSREPPNWNTLANELLGEFCACYAEAWPENTCHIERRKLAAWLKDRLAPPSLIASEPKDKDQ